MAITPSIAGAGAGTAAVAESTRPTQIAKRSMLVKRKRPLTLLASCTAVLCGFALCTPSLVLVVETSAFVLQPANSRAAARQSQKRMAWNKKPSFPRKRADIYDASSIPEKVDEEKENEASRRARQEKLLQAQKLEKASAAMDLPEQPLVRTLKGGSSLIFAMAKSMWAPPAAAGGDDDDENSSTSSVAGAAVPAANSAQGYATTIWKNARKRNKPGMWRYAVRTLYRMTATTAPGDSSAVAVTAGIQPLTTHYEGALTACAKLGLWQRALDIYGKVQERQAALSLTRQRKTTSSSSTSTIGTTTTTTTSPKKVKKPPRLAVQVTDSMIMSLVRACVRASRMRGVQDSVSDRNESSSNTTEEQSVAEQQRIPLDAVLEILQEMEAKHGLPLTARHLNPIAAAYLSLGLSSQAAALLQDNLNERTTGPEAEDGEDRLNINDLTAKDKASYSLLVQGAVSDGDWAGAVEALTNMTEAGLYPKPRHLNTWTEISERKTKQRATRSWKKKRDESYLDSVR